MSDGNIRDYSEQEVSQRGYLNDQLNAEKIIITFFFMKTMFFWLSLGKEIKITTDN